MYCQADHLLKPEDVIVHGASHSTNSTDGWSTGHLTPINSVVAISCDLDGDYSFQQRLVRLKLGNKISANLSAEKLPIAIGTYARTIGCGEFEIHSRMPTASTWPHQYNTSPIWIRSHLVGSHFF
ncbi:hypothetical protein U9M48_015121 [Paspalum notatum var. saurae]|uniref:Uncharacterized protein n=1 Tax=Paspalum notatum var. saurae TaxID=547442 RepID=A0AAQ3T2W3_PASNO